MNLMLSDVLLIALVLTAGGLWWHGQGMKARALKHVRRYCDQHDLQLLDESLVLRRLWPVRGRSGSMVLQRTWFFEFSSTGEYRYRGTVQLQGIFLKSIETQTHHLL